MRPRPRLLDRLCNLRTKLERWAHDESRRGQRLIITLLAATVIAAGMVELATDRRAVAVALPEPATPAPVSGSTAPPLPVGPVAALRPRR